MAGRVPVLWREQSRQRRQLTLHAVRASIASQPRRSIVGRRSKEPSSMRNQIVLLAAVCATLAGCADAPEPVAPVPETQAAAPLPELPATIVAERGGFIPEGIEYDSKSGRILTG